MVPGSSAAPLSWAALQAALPTGMYVERRDGALILESDRRNPRLGAAAIVLAILANALMVGTAMGLPLFAIGVAMGALPLTLFALARTFNTRRVVVTRHRIASTSTPVPWFGDRHVLETAHIRRFFVDRSSTTLFGTPASALWWQSDFGRGILVDDLPDDTIAGLLEQAIEEHLGLDGRTRKGPGDGGVTG
jgi:hypothetical protein